MADRTLSQVDSDLLLVEQTMARILEKLEGFATRVEQEQLTGIYQMQFNQMSGDIDRLERLIDNLVKGSR